jgi:PleD family two-component response regulator
VASVNRAFQVGATDFLSKPINWALLGHRVSYILPANRTFRALKDGEARLAKAQRMAQLGHWDWHASED